MHGGLEISKESPFGISSNVVMEFLKQSVNYDNGNRNSVGILGRQLFRVGRLDEAEELLLKVAMNAL